MHQRALRKHNLSLSHHAVLVIGGLTLFVMAIEQRLDGTWPVIGHRLQRVGEEGKLLVLGADLPRGLGLRDLRSRSPSSTGGSHVTPPMNILNGDRRHSAVVSL